MADIVGSLFGLSPDLVRAQLAKENEARAQFMAQNAPAGYGNIVYGASKLGQNIGSAVQGLLGIEDPQLQRATKLEKVLQDTQLEVGADISDPTKLYPVMIKNLKAAGLDREATQATIIGQNEMQDWLKTKATIKKEERAGLSEAERLIQDIEDSKAAGTTDKTKLLESRLEVLTQEKLPSIEQSIAYLRKKEADGTITTTEKTQLEKLKQDKLDIQKASAPRTTIEGPKAGYGGAETLINEQTKLLVPKQQTLANAEGSAQNALDLIKSDQLIQGTAADGRLAFATFLDTVGLGSDANKIRASKSNEFEATMAGQVMSTIKALGANPSNSDREFAKKTIASLGNTKEAAQAIAEYVLAKIKHERSQVDENLKFNADVLGRYSEGAKPSSKDVFTPKPFVYEKPQSTQDIEWLRSNKQDILKLGKIPLANRTAEQQSKLEKALQIMKATGVTL